MLMPDPDRERRPMHPKEYLESVSETERREKYTNLLAMLPPLAGVIAHRFPAADAIPDLRIVKNAPAGETELRDMLGAVYLAEGLLSDCVRIESQTYLLPNLPEMPSPLGSDSIAKIALMWGYAHEVFHYLRRHALIEKQFGSQAATKHALEYDADLCSLACVYRYVQRQMPQSDELTCKKSVLMNLFWPLREQVEYKPDREIKGSQTHPHAASRLLDAIAKLAMMNDGNVVDPTMSSPEIRLHFGELSNVLRNLELCYLGDPERERRGLTKESVVFEYLRINSKQHVLSERNKQWDKISPHIQLYMSLPRSIVDNEQTIALLNIDFPTTSEGLESLPLSPIAYQIYGTEPQARSYMELSRYQITAQSYSFKLRIFRQSKSPSRVVFPEGHPIFFPWYALQPAHPLHVLKPLSIRVE